MLSFRAGGQKTPAVQIMSFCRIQPEGKTVPSPYPGRIDYKLMKLHYRVRGLICVKLMPVAV
jgi:hypothetical protein